VVREASAGRTKEGENMKWTARVFGSVAVAALLAGCGGERPGDNARTAGAGTETGTMQDNAGVSTDTAQAGTRLRGDTNNPATGSDTASLNPGDTARPSGDTTTPSQ
jgi:hypothetical protein